MIKTHILRNALESRDLFSLICTEAHVDEPAHSQVFMIFLPAARFLTLPDPPGVFAARLLAADILAPLDFFAIVPCKKAIL